MRTYDDSFSGQKIYPGKVRYFGTSTSSESFGMEARIGDMVETSEEEDKPMDDCLMEETSDIGIPVN